MKRFDYDLFVIGAGSGGVAASRRAAALGARVAIAEASRVGGTCVIRGCVPKKLLVYASEFSDAFEDAAGFGWTVPEPSFAWSGLIAAKNREIDRLNGIYLRMLAGSGVALLEGKAALLDRHTIAIGGRQVSAENILIATGGHAVRPDIPGADLAITSNEALDLAVLPKRVLVVGGGYIACEFAGIFNGVGAKVIQIYRGEQILRGFDRECRDFLADELVRRGIDLRTRCDIAGIERRAGALRATLKDGTGLDVDAVLMATGRRPNTQGLGLDAAGVKLGAKGEVVVDAFSRSNVQNIHAIGDVTDRMNLTPVAINEGRAFAETVFARNPRRIDYRFVPRAVFSQPPLTSVGLSEEEARAAEHEIDLYKAAFRPMKHTLSGRETRSLMKLVVDAKTDVVLGVHMVGADAPEIVQSLAVALVCGATKAQFDATVALHPTAAEEFVTMREKWKP
ncbi:MAG: glutathione-disulfide reductase, partial [Alphaproteobacteria bacterium]|nr:glutathione-disulfide reductase [Alphaproteobacteria bacterium]